jgi:hypothetical protein
VHRERGLDFLTHWQVARELEKWGRRGGREAVISVRIGIDSDPDHPNILTVQIFHAMFHLVVFFFCPRIS